jgi:hypothetical protein
MGGNSSEIRALRLLPIGVEVVQLFGMDQLSGTPMTRFVLDRCIAFKGARCLGMRFKFSPHPTPNLTHELRDIGYVLDLSRP